MSKLPLQPLDLARETLRQLAQRRTPPTPDNFRSLYHEIAGTEAQTPFPAQELQRIALSLPRDTKERSRLATRLDTAIEGNDWDAVQQVLQECLGAIEVSRSWAGLLRELMAQIDTPHKQLTRARKLAALDHVLSANANNADLLFSRLRGLVQGWQREPLGESLSEHAEAAEPAEPAATAERRKPRDTSGDAAVPSATAEQPFAQWLALLLRQGIVPLLADNAALADEAAGIADAIDRTGAAPDEDLGARLRTFGSRLEWAGEDQRAVRGALLNLLRLIVDNISELVIDDQWLHGQVEALARMFDLPLDIRALDDLERRLRDVIDKQKHLKRQLTDAQERLKNMLVGFVDRLAGLSESTTQYHQTLADCATRIREASDIEELGTVVERLIGETQAVQETAARSSAEIGALRDEVEAANSLIARLQRELDETSELVRFDPLTGVLNRKGLDEVLEREIARARRQSSITCIGLLDLDNFKQLNDTFGHRTGDHALQHLAEVARGALRQEDIIGRLGGEEFLIVLPDTDEETAVKVMTRLQRALTTHIFIADNSRILITFSAGIATVGPDGNAHDAIDRADKAMYAAKRAGKNRVLVAA